MGLAHSRPFCRVTPGSTRLPASSSRSREEGEFLFPAVSGSLRGGGCWVGADNTYLLSSELSFLTARHLSRLAFSQDAVFLVLCFLESHHPASWLTCEVSCHPLHLTLSPSPPLPALPLAPNCLIASVGKSSLSIGARGTGRAWQEEPLRHLKGKERSGLGPGKVPGVSVLEGVRV